MRVNMGREGRTSSSLSANGGSMLGALILANGPSQPLEAATKYYVDSTFASLNANNVLDGVLPISSLPGFTGDATSVQGSNVITLSDLGVTPGSYAKVIVDAKGRVTGNDILNESDIPNIGWDKVQNKPNTLEGYGITDALSITGGVFGGQMSVIAPTNPLSSVSKQYVDSALSGNSAVVGDIIRKPFATTPTGFLRCNGGLVDKITYSDLYAVIGDNFNKYTVAGSGRPWQQQYEINTEHSGDIVGWASYGNLPEILHSGMFAVTKNRVYKFGGASTNNGYFTSVYYANINSDGSLGTWTNGINLPSVVISASVIVVKDKLYLIGGANSGGAISTVHTASINADGSLGNWSIFNNLPIAIAGASSFITKNRVYLLGGTNSGGTLSTVYYAVINSDGTLGAWIADTNLPLALQSSNIFVTKNRVYLCGGYNATNGILANVYTAPINPDGTIGTWTTGVALPVATYNAQYFATKTRAYIIGGITASNRTAAVYSAPINQDGTLGSWGAATSLPYVVSNAHSFIVKNKLYLLGGGTNSDWLSAIYSCPIYGGKSDYSEYYTDSTVNYLMPGSGRPWEQQYQINNSKTDSLNNWTTGTALPIAVSNAEFFVTKNRVYMCGGLTTGTIALASVYTASINADGSLGSWIADANLPGPLYASQAIVTKNRVYLIGGINANNGTSVTSTVYTATINADGTIGIWGTVTSIPTALSYVKSLITKNTIYIIGGWNGSAAVNTVYSAQINSDGTIGSWALNANTLPATLYASQMVVTKNRVYLIGGITNVSTYTTAIYTANISADGVLGPWLTATFSLPVTLGSQTFLVTKNNIFIFGGWNGSTAVSTVYRATIKTDGTIDTWIVYNSTITNFLTDSSLPGAIYGGGVIATKNKVHILGGKIITSASGHVNTVYTADISSDIQDYSLYYDGTITAVDYPNYTMPGSGKPWQQQYQINETQNSAITSWTTETSLPISVCYLTSFVTKNRVYICGGYASGNTTVSTVYTAPINTDGSLGTWVAATALPTALRSSQAIVTKNRVYILGGHNGSSAVSVVYSAVINADGTIGSWTTETSLPGSLNSSQAVVTKNRVYLIGGNNGSHLSTIYTAAINVDGTLGSWVSSGSLPLGISAGQAVVTRNRVYYIGGSTGSAVSNVYTAIINNDGTLGSWVADANLPGSLSDSQAIVTKNRIYLFCGHNGSAYVATVYTAAINSDGTLGAWTTGTSTSTTLAISQSIIVKNKVYLLGGYNSGLHSSAVISATILEGLNDYSPYYDGTIEPIALPTDTNLFALPDFSAREKNGVNLYIKH